MVALFAIAIYGATFRSSPSPTQPSGANQQQQVTANPENDDASLFFKIARFIFDERDVIIPATGIVAVAAAFWLAYLTLRLVYATRDLADSTRALAAGERARAAETAKATALAEKQFVLAQRQTDLTESQYGLERTRFYTQYRPELAIQFVRMLPDVPGADRITVEFSTNSVGASEAIVIGSAVRLDWIDPSKIPNPHDLDGEDLIPHRRFLVGASDRVQVHNTGESPADWEGADENLYLLGWVVYVDGRGEELGTTRTTYFLRQFSTGKDIFMIPGEVALEWNATQ